MVLVLVKLIFHPSGLGILGTCLCIPSELHAAATAGKARFRIATAPSTGLLFIDLGRSRADQLEKGCNGPECL